MTLLKPALFTFLLAIAPLTALADDTLPCPVTAPEVCFTPGTGCQELIVSRINVATKSVYVQAYSFTSPRIAAALVHAHDRGLDVRVILDRSDVTGRGTQIGALVAGGVPTWVDSAHAIAHNKVIVYDQSVVQTGSFNLTNAAEHANAENAVFLADATLAKLYTDNWTRHVAHSVRVLAPIADAK